MCVYGGSAACTHICEAAYRSRDMHGHCQPRVNVSAWGIILRICPTGRAALAQHIRHIHPDPVRCIDCRHLCCLLCSARRRMPSGHSRNRGRRDACEQVSHGLVVHGTATGTVAGREGWPRPRACPQIVVRAPADARTATDLACTLCCAIRRGRLQARSRRARPSDRPSAANVSTRLPERLE